MSSRRWMVVGAGGSLAADLLEILDDCDVRALTRQQLDVSDAPAVLDSIGNVDVVVNCAGYTSVDDAETNQEQAFAANAAGPQNLARACSRIGARLLHVSTDYVFAGDARSPYGESSECDPRSAYGRSKAAGEVAVQSLLPDRSWILRTAWLYGSHGPNFVSTMKRLESEQQTVDVVDDQCGQPTWTRDLATRIRLTVEHDLPPGVYHATNSGSASWFDLARAVFELLGADPNRVRRTTSARFPRPAARPGYSVLGHQRWISVGEEPMRSWRQALDEAAPVVLGTASRT
jgi:dTDP-4-dehydrorhamnose reductase